MQNLMVRMNAVLARIGGTREQLEFEYSHGMPREEQMHIVPVAPHLRRILSETEFAVRLSEAQNGRFDAQADAALSILEKALAEEGTVTRTAAAEAEKVLMPLSEAAKEYTLILVGHAHIDMNWMWSWPETVAATIATFTTMLDIMDEYPQFCFSQSQTSVYQIIDDYAPALHDRIQQRIDEGRWEVNASAWVETDKNMPDTESLLHHIKLSNEYLHTHWRIPEQTVDFSPDTFGHSANLPEIDTYGGIKYYYHCRGYNNKDYILYRWRAPSGKELLMYKEPYWYNSGVSPLPGLGIFEAAKRSGGLKTAMAVYGVGDHGGGPTRRDVERGIEMMSWPIFPAVRFGTLRDYFAAAESVRENLPVVDHELNFAFTGCYTTQSRIKRGNRRAEAALARCEAMTALARPFGYTPRPEAIREAWQKVLFTHFHDIITGSCVQDSREYALGQYQEALATLNSETGMALRAISDAIDTASIPTEPDADSQSEGAGVGYQVCNFMGLDHAERGGGLVRIWHIFNHTPTEKTEPVEITVWDWRGDMRFFTVEDAGGNALPFQLEDTAVLQYWDHKYFRIWVQLTVPAFSYATVVLRPLPKNARPIYFQPQWQDPMRTNFVLDNGILRAEFDYSSGELISLRDQKQDRELLSGSARPLLVDTALTADSAWQIGAHLEKTPFTSVRNLQMLANGAVTQKFAYEGRIRDSKVYVNYILNRGESFLRVFLTADWNEVGGETIPLLVYHLPTSSEATQFAYDVPAGEAIRLPDENDRPALSMVSTAEASPIGMISDCKYGFRAIKRGGKAHLICSLINTAKSPDPYPERGIQDIQLAIGPMPSEAAERKLQAVAAFRPLEAISTRAHKGILPPSGTLLSYSAPGCVLSSVSAEGDALLVRFYSVSDAPAEVSVTLPYAIEAASSVDLFGNDIAPANSSGNTASAVVAPRAICTLKIRGCAGGKF